MPGFLGVPVQRVARGNLGAPGRVSGGYFGRSARWLGHPGTAVGATRSSMGSGPTSVDWSRQPRADGPGGALGTPPRGGYHFPSSVQPNRFVGVGGDHRPLDGFEGRSPRAGSRMLGTAPAWSGSTEPWRSPTFDRWLGLPGNLRVGGDVLDAVEEFLRRERVRAAIEARNRNIDGHQPDVVSIASFKLPRIPTDFTVHGSDAFTEMDPGYYFCLNRYIASVAEAADEYERCVAELTTYTYPDGTRVFNSSYCYYDWVRNMNDVETRYQACLANYGSVGT
jgi:hypothetical protein